MKQIKRIMQAEMKETSSLLRIYSQKQQMKLSLQRNNNKIHPPAFSHSFKTAQKQMQEYIPSYPQLSLPSLPYDPSFASR